MRLPPLLVSMMLGILVDFTIAGLVIQAWYIQISRAVYNAHFPLFHPFSSVLSGHSCCHPRSYSSRLASVIKMQSHVQIPWLGED